MKRYSILIASLIALGVTVPAQAEKSDRIIIENMRARIHAARNELGTSRAGEVELSEAEGRLRELFKALDDNEMADARASINGMDALIAAARVRAVASTHTAQASPARWTPSVSPAPTRKRTSDQKPARRRSACRIASR